jgi:hypothetical protein
MPAPSNRSWSLQRRSRRLAWFLSGAAIIMVTAACGGTPTSLPDACGEPPQPAILYVSSGEDDNATVAYTFIVVGAHPASLIEVTAASIGTGSGGSSQSVETRDFFCFVPTDASRLGQPALASFTLLGEVSAETTSTVYKGEADLGHFFDGVLTVGGQAWGDDPSSAQTFDSTVIVPVTLGTWMRSNYSMDVRVGVTAGTTSRGKAALSITFNGVSAGGSPVSLAQVRTASGASY